MNESTQGLWITVVSGGLHLLLQAISPETLHNDELWFNEQKLHELHVFWIEVNCGLCLCQREGKGYRIVAAGHQSHIIVKALEIIQEQPFWERSNGVDHIWILTQDHGCESQGLYPTPP